MMRPALTGLLATLLVGCGGGGEPVPEVQVYNIDATRISVSGVSSGAMMATQMHLAHSRLVDGAALIAGGPYYCAENSLKKGLGPCMNGGEIGVEALVDYAQANTALDPLENLADDSVWLFHGANDAVMHADTTAAAARFYEDLANIDVVAVTDIEALHGFPTIDAGVACDAFEAPFLNACDYDAAGELLAHLAGNLQPRATATGELVEIPQPGAGDATMLPNALAYVPQSCAAGDACGVHVAFHGCQQSTSYVGDAFARLAGYNEWAESNALIVLYPQVDSSKIAPMNPMGCWDWWGYTDENYATRDGAQIKVVKATLDLLAGKTL